MQVSVKNNKIVVEFTFNDIDEDIISLLSSFEIVNKSKATEEAIYELSQKIKKDWWERNKDRFINDENSGGQ